MTTITEAAVLVYDRTLGVAAMENRGFYYPVDVAINREGRIYGLNRSHEGDPRGVRVCIFDLDSKFYGVFGSVGEADGEFTWATSIAIDPLLSATIPASSRSATCALSASSDSAP